MNQQFCENVFSVFKTRFVTGFLMTVPHHYWQSGVNHNPVSGTLRTVTEPQSNLRLFAGSKAFLAGMSLSVAKKNPQTITYEHTQIPVTHLAKLHTYSCRPVLIYTFLLFLFFFWRTRSIGVGVVRTMRPQSVLAMLVDWRRTRSLCAPPSLSVKTLHSDRK